MELFESEPAIRDLKDEYHKDENGGCMLIICQALSGSQSEHCYSRAELEAIEKFNSLFKKTVVLPSNKTFAGINPIAAHQKSRTSISNEECSYSSITSFRKPCWNTGHNSNEGPMTEENKICTRMHFEYSLDKAMLLISSTKSIEDNILERSAISQVAFENYSTKYGIGKIQNLFFSSEEQACGKEISDYRICRISYPISLTIKKGGNKRSHSKSEEIPELKKKKKRKYVDPIESKNYNEGQFVKMNVKYKSNNKEMNDENQVVSIKDIPDALISLNKTFLEMFSPNFHNDQNAEKSTKSDISHKSNKHVQINADRTTPLIMFGNKEESPADVKMAIDTIIRFLKDVADAQKHSGCNLVKSIQNTCEKILQHCEDNNDDKKEVANILNRSVLEDTFLKKSEDLVDKGNEKDKEKRIQELIKRIKDKAKCVCTQKLDLAKDGETTNQKLSSTSNFVGNSDEKRIIGEQDRRTAKNPSPVGITIIRKCYCGNPNKLKLFTIDESKKREREKKLEELVKDIIKKKKCICRESLAHNLEVGVTKSAEDKKENLSNASSESSDISLDAMNRRLSDASDSKKSSRRVSFLDGPVLADSNEEHTYDVIKETDKPMVDITASIMSIKTAYSDESSEEQDDIDTGQLSQKWTTDREDDYQSNNENLKNEIEEKNSNVEKIQSSYALEKESSLSQEEYFDTSENIIEKSIYSHIPSNYIITKDNVEYDDEALEGEKYMQFAQQKGENNKGNESYRFVNAETEPGNDDENGETMAHKSRKNNEPSTGIPDMKNSNPKPIIEYSDVESGKSAMQNKVEELNNRGNSEMKIDRNNVTADSDSHPNHKNETSNSERGNKKLLDHPTEQERNTERQKTTRREFKERVSISEPDLRKAAKTNWQAQKVDLTAMEINHEMKIQSQEQEKYKSKLSIIKEQKIENVKKTKKVKKSEQQDELRKNKAYSEPKLISERNHEKSDGSEKRKKYVNIQENEKESKSKTENGVDRKHLDEHEIIKDKKTLVSNKRQIRVKEKQYDEKTKKKLSVREHYAKPFGTPDRNYQQHVQKAFETQEVGGTVLSINTGENGRGKSRIVRRISDDYLIAQNDGLKKTSRTQRLNSVLDDIKSQTDFSKRNIPCGPTDPSFGLIKVEIPKTSNGKQLRSFHKNIAYEKCKCLKTTTGLPTISDNAHNEKDQTIDDNTITVKKNENHPEKKSEKQTSEDVKEIEETPEEKFNRINTEAISVNGKQEVEVRTTGDIQHINTKVNRFKTLKIISKFPRKRKGPESRKNILRHEKNSENEEKVSHKKTIRNHRLDSDTTERRQTLMKNEGYSSFRNTKGDLKSGNKPADDKYGSTIDGKFERSPMGKSKFCNEELDNGTNKWKSGERHQEKTPYKIPIYSRYCKQKKVRIENIKDNYSSLKEGTTETSQINISGNEKRLSVLDDIHSYVGNNNLNQAADVIQKTKLKDADITEKITESDERLDVSKPIGGKYLKSIAETIIDDVIRQSNRIYENGAYEIGRSSAEDQESYANIEITCDEIDISKLANYADIIEDISLDKAMEIEEVSEISPPFKKKKSTVSCDENTINESTRYKICESDWSSSSIKNNTETSDSRKKFRKYKYHENCFIPNCLIGPSMGRSRIADEDHYVANKITGSETRNLTRMILDDYKPISNSAMDNTYIIERGFSNEIELKKVKGNPNICSCPGLVSFPTNNIEQLQSHGNMDLTELDTTSKILSNLESFSGKFKRKNIGQGTRIEVPSTSSGYIRGQKKIPICIPIHETLSNVQGSAMSLKESTMSSKFFSASNILRNGCGYLTLTSIDTQKEGSIKEFPTLCSSRVIESLSKKILEQKNFQICGTNISPLHLTNDELTTELCQGKSVPLLSEKKVIDSNLTYNKSTNEENKIQTRCYDKSFLIKNRCKSEKCVRFQECRDFPSSRKETNYSSNRDKKNENMYGYNTNIYIYSGKSGFPKYNKDKEHSDLLKSGRKDDHENCLSGAILSPISCEECTTKCNSELSIHRQNYAQKSMLQYQNTKSFSLMTFGNDNNLSTHNFNTRIIEVIAEKAEGRSSKMCFQKEYPEKFAKNSLILYRERFRWSDKNEFESFVPYLSFEPLTFRNDLLIKSIISMNVTGSLTFNKKSFDAFVNILTNSEQKILKITDSMESKAVSQVNFSKNEEFIYNPYATHRRDTEKGICQATRYNSTEGRRTPKIPEFVGEKNYNVCFNPNYNFSEEKFHERIPNSNLKLSKQNQGKRRKLLDHYEKQHDLKLRKIRNRKFNSLIKMGKSVFKTSYLYDKFSSETDRIISLHQSSSFYSGVSVQSTTAVSDNFQETCRENDEAEGFQRISDCIQHFSHPHKCMISTTRSNDNSTKHQLKNQTTPKPTVGCFEPISKNTFHPYGRNISLFTSSVEYDEITTYMEKDKRKPTYKELTKRMINWVKSLGTNSKPEEALDKKSNDAMWNAEANLMKQRKILRSKLRYPRAKTSKLYLHKRDYDQMEQEKKEMLVVNKIEPVLREIASNEILEPEYEDEEDEYSELDEELDEEAPKTEKDKHLLVLSEDSMVLFDRKKVYDRLQKCGKLFYTIYFDQQDDLDHISIRSAESVEHRIECEDRPFFAAYDLGPNDVRVRVAKDIFEERRKEAIFKNENYVECQNSKVKLSLMRGKRYITDLDPTKAKIIEIDCTNQFSEIKICYKKNESKECICEYPQVCRAVQLESSELSSVDIDKEDKSQDTQELERDGFEAETPNADPLEPDSVRAAKKLQCEHCKDCRENPESCDNYEKCLSDHICADKRRITMFREDSGNFKTVEFCRITEGFRFDRSDSQEESERYESNGKDYSFPVKLPRDDISKHVKKRQKKLRKKCNYHNKW